MTKCNLFVILVLIAGISLLIGCRPQQPPASSTTTTTANDLVVWIDNDDWAKAVIAGFNAKYPDVNVRFENIGNVDSRAKVSLDGPAGQGPDVFFMPHDHISSAHLDDILLPFDANDQRRYAGFILDAAMATCTFDGQLYAVPLTTENIALFYNKDLLCNTPVPKSIEEIAAFAMAYNNPAQNKWAIRWAVNDA
jgi:arabinogalactan oligomer/maltooligosaccharide transport system substrate-binding protein